MTTELLKALCEVQSPSGEEGAMKEFILNYVRGKEGTWRTKPVILEGDEWQDCLILVFGTPKVAAFAHMDTTGFTVRYQDQLVPIGGPDVVGDEMLVGADDLGEIECRIFLDEDDHARYAFGRGIRTGTSLVYKNNYLENGSFIQAPYLDNRVGIFNLLTVAETLENGALVFSCWEEHGGGSVPYLVKYLYERWKINKMLVADVTWATDGVFLEDGVVISHRDRSIPRRSFVRRIIDLAESHDVPHQAEVEAHGASDGREIQASPYPIDWCFVGPPVENVHTEKEKIARNDLESSLKFYQILMQAL